MFSRIEALKKTRKPWPEDAPEGKTWKCPDCGSQATLGGNAGFHRDNEKHREPVLVDFVPEHLKINPPSDFTRGFFCAVASFITAHGSSHTGIREVFKQGGDPLNADPQDIETFKQHGLMK